MSSYNILITADKLFSFGGHCRSNYRTNNTLCQKLKSKSLTQETDRGKAGSPDYKTKRKLVDQDLSKSQITTV